jgi:hypothetical protein
MAGTPLIISAALTTGSILGPGGYSIAAHPTTQALTAVLLIAALAMSAFAAYRSATGPVRPAPPAGPALPKLRRRINGPRDRRA